MDIQLQQHHLLKRIILSQMLCNVVFIINQVIYARICLWTLYYILFLSLSILAPNSECLNYYNFIISLISGGMSLPALFFFFKITLDIFGLLYFHMNFRTSLLISAKEPAEILIEITLNLYFKLGRINIFTTVSFPFHKYGKSLHLFRLFQISYLHIILSASNKSSIFQF